MSTPKLYRLLARLEKSELHWLDKFLASPFHNANADLLRLYRLLRPAHPDFENHRAEAVYQHFFPGKNFRAKWVNDRFSELTACILEFLSIREYQQDEALQQQVYRRALGRRGLYRPLSRLIQQQLEAIKTQPLSDQFSIRRLRALRMEQFNLPDYRQPDRGRQIVDDILELTDRDYRHTQLHFAIDLLARGKTFAEEAGGLLPEEQLQTIADHAEEDPLLAIYLSLYQLYRGRAPQSDYLPLTARFLELFPKMDRAISTFLLVKFCSLGVGWMNRGNTAYAGHLFPLYRLGVEEGYFLQYSHFPEDTFLNICTIGAFIGEYAWTANFINDHQGLLESSESANTIALGRALIAFHSGDFSAVHQLLNRVSSRRLKYTLRIRSLRVRCLLELYICDRSVAPTLQSELKSFKQFLKRTRRQSPEWKQGYFHFIVFAKRFIAQLESAGSRPPDFSLLQAEVAATEPVALKSWLLERLAEYQPSPD